MEIDTSKLTDEQITKLGEFIKTMEKENEVQKWWVIPKWSVLAGNNLEYIVEPEQDLYERCRPPLKRGFASQEEAQKWLENYLKEEDLFLKGKDELNNLKCNLGHLYEKLAKHEYLSLADIHNCFESFNASIDHGSLKELTKGE